MPTQLSLFGSQGKEDGRLTGAVILRGFATPHEHLILSLVEAIAQRAPFRHMVTPGGHTMSVATTSCGSWGWVTDPKGYRYESKDPHSGQSWPPLPELFLTLATSAAQMAGFPNFKPDACLINLYKPGAKLSLHQDKDELDFTSPIVSVSLGLPAIFLFGGLQRKDLVKKALLEHGDVVIWGGPARLAYHGILPLKKGNHPLLGKKRFNLTFRRAMGTGKCP